MRNLCICALVTTGIGAFVWLGPIGCERMGPVAACLVKTDAQGNKLWTRTFGGNSYDDMATANAAVRTSDGGFVLAGDINAFLRKYDLYLVKTDAEGREEWIRTFGGFDYDTAEAVRQTSDGGYILAGYTYSFGEGDANMYLVKTDTHGNEEWSKTFGEAEWIDKAFDVQQTSDGGYIVAGETGLFEAGIRDVYMVKTDAQGNEVWSKTLGGEGWDMANAMQQTSDGGYILAGGASRDMALVRTDSEGNELWTKTFGGGDYEEARAIQQTSDGGYILAGYTAAGGEVWSAKDSGEGEGEDEGDMYLVKADGSGNIEWSATFGGSEWEGAEAVQQTADDGYVVAGWLSQPMIGRTIEIVRTDGQGRKVWSRNLGGVVADAVVELPDGGLVFAGATD